MPWIDPLHCEPELSGAEWKAHARIRDALQGFGVKDVTGGFRTRGELINPDDVRELNRSILGMGGSHMKNQRSEVK